ncbi:MAG: cytochrome c biogenesis protein CcsA [Candidatus Zipacnadales bacterium]
MNLPPLLLIIPACAYLSSGLLYTWRLISRRGRRAATVGLASGSIGALLHGVFLLLQFTENPPAICATVSGAASLIAFLTAAAFLAVERPFRLEAIGSAVMPLCFGATLYAALNFTAPAVPDTLRSAWFFIHVPSALLAYVAFAFAFAAATTYLGEGRLLRSKRLAAVVGVMPSLDQLESTMYRTTTFGFLLLSIGMATGALWAQDVWGTYWSWEPKQTASLVTWLVFAGYLHHRLVRGSRGRNGAWLIVVGFVCVILTFLVVGGLEHDLHRFL